MIRLGSALLLLLLASGLALGAFETPPYQPVTVTAKVAPYTVKRDLGNVANRKQFGAFTSAQKALLAKQAFFAAPTSYQQLYSVYETNDYIALPNFVTSDSVLQLYHIFFDYSLRGVEADRLVPICEKLTRHLLAQSVSTYTHLPEGPVRAAARRNVAYFGVAAKALALKVDLPAEAEKLVAAEWASIAKHEGRRPSAIFPYSFDFSQFVPRGHYTRSEKLKRYFMAMMWYGLIPLPLEWPERPPTTAYEQIRQSLLITRALYETELDGKPAIQAWERIYEPTAFYVELSDDLTPVEWKETATAVWGHLPSPAELAQKAKLDAFHDAAMKLRAPRIATFPGKTRPIDTVVDIPTGRQFRLMGQRAIPDSYVLQQLVWSNVGADNAQRRMPKGLDVFAALGSARALALLEKSGDTKFARYTSQMDKLRKEFGAVPESSWRQNLYWGWLWTLRGLTAPVGAGYPSFMRSPAWLDKQLNTGLASWTELRHDTLLYGKQSMAAEGGDVEPPAPKAYVEPVPEVYHRLLWLTQATRQGLRTRRLLSPALDEALGKMESLLTFLEQASLKELAGQALTRAEYKRIQQIGGEMERITQAVSMAIGTAEGELTTEADDDMAIVADVHSDLLKQACLEEAVGHVLEIYVVVPIQGKLYLTRGAAFSYYEFPHPLADRLTDEKWQAMLRGKTAPKQPAWTAAFMTGPKAELPVPKTP